MGFPRGKRPDGSRRKRGRPDETRIPWDRLQEAQKQFCGELAASVTGRAPAAAPAPDVAPAPDQAVLADGKAPGEASPPKKRRGGWPRGKKRGRMPAERRDKIAEILRRRYRADNVPK